MSSPTLTFGSCRGPGDAGPEPATRPEASSEQRSTSLAAKVRALARIPAAVMFLAALWLPLLDSGYRLDRTPAPVENRMLAPFPALGAGVAGLKKYLSGLEAYFNDNFGFRNFLIRTHSRVRWSWFGQGGADVLVGREPWLFYSGEEVLDSHLGLRLLSQKELGDWQQLIERRRDWLARRGIKYLFVVAPDKESVYPEFMPAWANHAQASTLLDQLVAHMRAHSSVEILDLRPAVRAAKTNVPIYLATDTHWNCLGAFAAYQEIIRTLAQQLPGLEPLPFSAFEVKRLRFKGGDLAKLSAREQTAEPNYLVLEPRAPLAPLDIRADVSILAKAWPPTHEPLCISMPTQQYKAVVFRDSFTDFLKYYLGYNFKRSVFIWQRNWDLGLIEREKPDVVIDETIERYLHTPVVDKMEGPPHGNTYARRDQ